MQSTYQVDLGHLNVIPGAWESQQRGAIAGLTSLLGGEG